MRNVVSMAIGFALVFSFLAATARGDDKTGMPARPPATVEHLAVDYETYAAEDEPADESLAEPSVPADDPTVAGDEVISAPAVRVASGGSGGPGLWTLRQPQFLADRGVKVGGWIQQGITLNAHATADGFNGPLATNDLDSEYQLNQLWLFFDRQADNGGYGWAIGGHVDMLYGTDWRFGVNPGLENRINTIGGQTYGMVIPQAYVEVAFHDLSVKLGHFAGILDYEIIPSVGNPFYSHSYCYGYTTPQLVTGALADYKVSDQFSVQGGFHRGWFMFEDLNHHMDFMGGLKFNSYDQRTSLAYAITYGPQDPAGAADTFAHSLVLKRQVTDRLQYVLVQNYGFVNDGIVVPDVGVFNAEWYGINQYLLYSINPRWSANVRFEWLRDDDGAAVVSPAAMMPPLRTFDGSGFAGNFFEVTAGLNWRPHPNFLVRPEVRWDWYDGLPGQVAGAPGFPFNDGASTDQFTFACDLIITF